MLNGLEITKAALDDFKKIQAYMHLAKKENAIETYAELKKEYFTNHEQSETVALFLRA